MVELPGVKNLETAKAIIGKTAELELYDLQTAAVGPSASSDPQAPAVPSASLYDLLASASTQSLRSDNTAENGPYYLFQRKGKKLLAGPAPTRGGAAAQDVTERCRRERVSFPCRPTR